jgi:hypothetical protein
VARVEFGIVNVRTPEELHRGPMTGEEALKWIREFEEMDGKPGAFIMVSRIVGDWELCKQAKALDG